MWQNPLAVQKNKFSLLPEHTAGYFPAPLQLDMFCNWVLAAREWGCVCHWCSLRLQYTISNSVVWDLTCWKRKKPTFWWSPTSLQRATPSPDNQKPHPDCKWMRSEILLCLSYYPFLFIFVTGASVTLIWIAWARFQQKHWRTLKHFEPLSSKFWEKKQQKRQFFYGSPETIVPLSRFEVVYLQCHEHCA